MSADASRGTLAASIDALWPSPDGRWLAYAAVGERTLVVWDPVARREVLSYPVPDGALLLVH